MKRPLQIGDRVRIYDGEHTYKGTILHSGTSCFGIKEMPGYVFNQKQARRLRPKEKSVKVTRARLSKLLFKYYEQYVLPFGSRSEEFLKELGLE